MKSWLMTSLRERVDPHVELPMDPGQRDRTVGISRILSCIDGEMDASITK